MLKSPFILFLVIGLNLQSFAQNQTEERAKNLTFQLENWYNLETGLWDTASWWNSANVLTALINHAKLIGDDKFKETVAYTFEKAKEFEVEATDKKDAWVCKNFINDFYDDEGWWALAWLDAWEYTGEQRYLNMANIIFEDIIAGWSENGGLYWKKGLKYRGSISNGLTLTLATRLHLAGTKNVNGKSALHWATTIWEWMIQSNLLDSNGNIQDGVRSINGEETISKNVWTYNQGVVLTGLVNLHKITGKESYLKNAEAIAEATLNHMTNDDLILIELLCEPYDCNEDAKQFKGVFMRHLMYLNNYSPKKEYKLFIQKNIESIWVYGMMFGTVSPGVSWNRSSQANAATVSSALDAFNAALSLRD